MIRKSLLAAALAGTAALGLVSTAQAERAVVASTLLPSHIVLQAPPPPVFENVPAPRDGWVWAPGHYEWRGGQYVWTSGRWVEDRPGWAWQEARWLQRPDGSWYLVSGQWVRDTVASDDRRGRRGPNGDLDGDGVRNADDGDRDGDGVVNRHDDYPNDEDRS